MGLFCIDSCILTSLDIFRGSLSHCSYFPSYLTAIVLHNLVRAWPTCFTGARLMIWVERSLIYCVSAADTSTHTAVKTVYVAVYYLAICLLAGLSKL